MAKAKFNLATGGTVDVDGTPQEIHELLKLCSGEQTNTTQKSKLSDDGNVISKKSQRIKKKESNLNDEDEINLTKIVNTAKECKEAELIEANILDRTSQIDKTLLPLYIIHEYFDNSFGLQSGEISNVTKQLGIPIAQPNVSKTLSITASRYVMGDKVRKGKQAIKYKLNRRGVQYLQAVIKGSSNG